MKRSGFSRLRIENYQSIEHVDVPLGPFTTIIGDNAAGKSAILRAIKAACFNETGTGFISHGATKTEVELTLSSEGVNTHRLLWRKKREGGATYDLETADGYMSQGARDSVQHFSKLGQAVPPEVATALNIARIEVDKTLTLTPQVHEQGEYAFLLDRSEGQAARALAKMTKLDVVVEAQGLIRTDLKRTKSDLKATDDALADLLTQMEEFTGLDAELTLLERLKVEMADIDDAYVKVTTQRLGLEVWARARTRLDECGTLPPLADLNALIAGANSLRDQRRAYRLYNEVLADVSLLPETLPDMPDLTAQAERVAAQRVAWQAWQEADIEAADSSLDLIAANAQHAEAIAAYNALDVCPECGALLEKVTA